MISTIFLSLLSLSSAFFLSKNDNFFKTSENKLLAEFDSFFSHSPKTFELNIPLRRNNKYQLEFFLFVFVMIIFLFINAFVSHIIMKFFSFNGDEVVESLFKTLLIEFIIIISTALVLNKFKETILNQKKISLGEFYQAMVSADKIYVPFVTLEGAVATELSKTANTYLAIPLNEVKEFSIEPSKRVVTLRGYAWTPPYYKILINEKISPIYVLRSYFFGHERLFLDHFSFKLKITFNDSLRD